MKTAWNSISGIVQGDITYSLRTISLSDSSADFSLIAYSEKWEKFDISFEYRAKKEDEWRKDAFLTMSNANKIAGNKIMGLDATKYGAINVLRWDYARNAITYGENIEVRIVILPRFRQFSTSGTSNIVSQIYGKNWADVDGASNVKVLNTNNDGQYICKVNSCVYIKDSLNEDATYSSCIFTDVTHAIHLPNRNYLVSDVGASELVEMNETLSSVVRTFAISNVAFFDYHERNETILVTRKNSNTIEEYTWGEDSYGESIWSSSSIPSLILAFPESASYKVGDANSIVIADSGKNRIALVDRTSDSINYVSKFRFYEDESSGNEMLNFHNPFRVFWIDDNIYIVEKEGKVLTFETAMSSSSSSSSGI